MLDRLRHVCFDKDGTIIDVHMYWLDIVNKRARKLLVYYKLDLVHQAALAYAMGIDSARKKIILHGPVGYKPRNFVVDAAGRALKALGVDAKTEEINNIFASVDMEMREKDDYHLKLLKNVRKTLERLKMLGFKVSMYTSDRTHNAQHIMKKLRLNGYIDAIIGGDEIIKPKPDAEGFKKACDWVGVPLSQSIYVGDTLDDMIMAASCGSLGGVGVATGLCSKEQLSGKAKFVIDNLDDLGGYFERRERG